MTKSNRRHNSCEHDIFMIQQATSSHDLYCHIEYKYTSVEYELPPILFFTLMIKQFYVGLHMRLQTFQTQSDQ